MSTELKDFARIERAADGRQVLFYKATDDEGSPQLCQVLEHEGVLVELNLSFPDDDNGWNLLDEIFAVVDPDRVLKTLLKAIESGEFP